MAREFQFVTLAHPNEVKSRQNQNLIRVHAIRGAVRKEDRRASARRRGGGPPKLTKTPCPGRLDPFDSLPQCPERLRALTRHKNARQAGEPIFFVGESGLDFFEGLDIILHGALTDSALFHALSLCLELAANDGKINVECLTHRGEALKEIASGLSIDTEGEGNAIPASTLNAMLLLVGYEYRVDGANYESVSIHMEAVHEAVQVCNRANVFFCETLRRALFWQDLTSCLLVGTRRRLSHGDFPELMWKRDPFRRSFYVLPPGFVSVLPQLPGEMVEVLEDLNALCILLNARCMCGDLPISRVSIDNAQAWIESRLVDMLVDIRVFGFAGPLLRACLFATFACTYKLSTSIWDGSLVPAFCASEILHIMQQAEEDPEWTSHPDFLLWLLFVGGSCAVGRNTRLQFVALILGSYRERVSPHADWLEVERILKTFVWSNRTSDAQYREFWEEVHPR